MNATTTAMTTANAAGRRNLMSPPPPERRAPGGASEPPARGPVYDFRRPGIRQIAPMGDLPRGPASAALRRRFLGRRRLGRSRGALRRRRPAGALVLERDLHLRPVGRDLALVERHVELDDFRHPEVARGL